MKKTFLSIILMIITVLLFGDTRTENIDVIILLDKSNSMRVTVDSVKEYVNSFVFDQLLVPGDYIQVIGFYGKTEILLSGEYGENTKNRFKTQIRDVRGNGDYTDIGSALDRLQSEYDLRKNNGRRKYLLLMTDGKQDAPKESPYYSPDKRFNHQLLENTKEIKKQGWKIHIIGIGTETVAEELAEELAAHYEEVSPEPETEELTEATEAEELFGIIEAAGKPKLIFDEENTKGRIIISLKSSGYSEAKTIEVKKVVIYNGDDQIGEFPLDDSVLVEPEDTTDKAFNFALPGETIKKAKSEDASMSLEFYFTGETTFTPAVLDVSFELRNPVDEADLDTITPEDTRQPDGIDATTGEEISKNDNSGKNAENSASSVPILLIVGLFVGLIIILLVIVFLRGGMKPKDDEKK